jgi:hypothetical protein
MLDFLDRDGILSENRADDARSPGASKRLSPQILPVSVYDGPGAAAAHTGRRAER